MKYQLWLNYSTTSKRIRINKLKGLENWTSWKFQVRLTLKSCGAWEIYSYRSVLPVSGDNTTNGARGRNSTSHRWMNNHFCIPSTVNRLKTRGKSWNLYEQKSNTSVIRRNQEMIWVHEIDSKYREKLWEWKNSFDEIIILKTTWETNVFQYNLERKVFSGKKVKNFVYYESISFIPLVLYLD